MMVSTLRAFAPTFNRYPSRAFSIKTQMGSITRNPDAHSSTSKPTETPITLQEWQGWGSTSPVPTMVTEIIDELKVLEKNVDAQMSFGGNGGKLQSLLNPILNYCFYIPCNHSTHLDIANGVNGNLEF
ncbi:DTW domain-containing protein isoform 1 [Cucumis melo var. makuwa]|uniref:DTW domain-containing protein isoform 1 n=1 Tax=Cucumis melo var. makuwa TaxID=1194695 RepID=A0A5D3C0R0_CUCMM|nr:DTW domain-containing protein isoform 1 [Cucumis melo var. makuwa]